MIYTFSLLSLLISGFGLWIGTTGSRFEGGAGYAGCFAFLVGAGFSIIVAFQLYKHWGTLAMLGKIVGVLGCLPLLTVLVVLVYVLFIY